MCRGPQKLESSCRNWKLWSVWIRCNNLLLKTHKYQIQFEKFWLCKWFQHSFHYSWRFFHLWSRKWLQAFCDFVNREKISVKSLHVETFSTNVNLTTNYKVKNTCTQLYFSEENKFVSFVDTFTVVVAVVVVKAIIFSTENITKWKQLRVWKVIKWQIA